MTTSLFSKTVEGFVLEVIPARRCGWIAGMDTSRYWFRLTGTGVQAGDRVAFELDNAGGQTIAINVRAA